MRYEVTKFPSPFDPVLAVMYLLHVRQPHHEPRLLESDIKPNLY